MLTNLKIENIAIIESASIDFAYNFNCMTGETGAGKSIIIDSINAILGEKTSRELIRTGETKATVSAYFSDISQSTCDLLTDFGIPVEDDNTLFISRVMTKDGRNNCKINGMSVTVSMLKTIGLSLINIHGQADNQQLMLPEYHYTFVDAVADNNQLLEDYRKTYYKLIEVKDKIKKLTVNESMKARQIDLLSYQIDELKKADIRIGEKEELVLKRDQINNSHKLVSALNESYFAINGSDDFNGASSLLFDAARSLSEVAKYMPEIAVMAESVNDIAYTVESYGSEINTYIENSYFDEHELADIEERLDVIYRMSKKYGETEEEMLNFLDKAQEELHNITCSDELLKELNIEYDNIRKLLSEKAEKLSQSRISASADLSFKIQNELAFLDMPETVFTVNIKNCDFSENGINEIEFLISTNKGEEPKPLAKIASGGELSRIMLAIKSVLADKDGTDTLIFDEIDTGVSGRAAGKIAKKLNDVSKNRQVICITHLPSIAAFADHHMCISKAVKGEKTYTSVTPLDIDGRISEISRIIGGDENDKIYLESAKQLLNEAMNYK